MIAVKIDGVRHFIPSSLADITLATHLRVQDVERTMPVELAQVMEENDPVVRELQAQRMPKKLFVKSIVPYFARVLSVFLDMPADKILGRNNYQSYAGLPVPLICDWYWKCVGAYQVGLRDDLLSFDIDGTVYHLPETEMTKSTFGEFAEAAAYEEAAADVAAGKFYEMAGVLAVLLREEGWRYDPDTWEAEEAERKAKMMQASMQTVYAVAFFLNAQNERLRQDSLIWQLASAAARQRLAQPN